MDSEPIGVRPTKRCLGDLRAELPDLGVRLEELDQAVIVSAQAVPEQRDAVTELRGPDLPGWVRPSRGAWWIGAAGWRQADSAQRDFYASLTRECTKGKTSHQAISSLSSGTGTAWQQNRPSHGGAR